MIITKKQLEQQMREKDTQLLQKAIENEREASPKELSVCKVCRKRRAKDGKCVDCLRSELQGVFLSGIKRK